MAASFKKDPITTSIGTILMLLGIWITYDTYDKDGFKTWADFILPLGVIVVGAVFVRSPDSFSRIVNKAADKKLDK